MGASGANTPGLLQKFVSSGVAEKVGKPSAGPVRASAGAAGEGWAKMVVLAAFRPRLTATWYSLDQDSHRERAGRVARAGSRRC